MQDPTVPPAEDDGLPSTEVAFAAVVPPAAATEVNEAAQAAAPQPADEAGSDPAAPTLPEAEAGPADGLSAEPVAPDAQAEQAAQAAQSTIAELSPAACAARLADLFPALFKGPPKPLKLRIQADIQQRTPGVFTRRSLSAFLHRHTTTTAYLLALSQARERIDLDGAPAGELADEHRQAAITELARRRALHEERRAAENAARRAAETQARQAHAAADQARRERALLLRAFETSTLTRANFCALKRIDEAELDALLATARQEASQAAFSSPPERRPDAERGQRADGRRDDRREDRGGAGRPAGPRLRPNGGPRKPMPAKPQR